LEDNDASLVSVGNGGELILKSGKITGNSTEGGGGVNVVKGTFTMEGGAITGNTATGVNSGGGVKVSGIFTMTGGTISGNNAEYGGGMNTVQCVFTMEGVRFSAIQQMAPMAAAG
jgi:hypothetical protein